MALIAHRSVAIGLIAAVWTLLLPGRPFQYEAALQRLASDTCSDLRALLGPSVITLPSDTQQYDDLRDDNWSQAAWKHPSCIATPASTSDLSAVVRTLAYSKVPFAIRSGGHSPNPFDANIDNGVLISLGKFDRVAYDESTTLATLGTGARWRDVYTALDRYNLTVVGGRFLGVGVGGLTLGGGLSYLSDLHGLVCDNVVSYEVCLRR